MNSRPLPGLNAAKQNWYFFKTRFKLPLWFVLIGLFVLFTIGTVGIVEYLCFRNGQQAAESLANQLMQNVSGRVELYLNTYLQTPQLVNQLNANAVLLGELNLQDLPGVEQHLLTQLQQFESISSIQVGNSQQDFRAITRQNGLRLLQSNGTEPTQVEEYRLDVTGRKTQLISTSEQTSVRNQLWYQAALFAGKPTWGPISKLSNSESSSLTAIQPIYDSQRQARGVFASAIFLNTIGSFLHDLPVGKSGEVFILEQDGWTVATSNRGLPENYSLVNRFNLINSPVSTERTAARSLIDRFGDFSRIDRPQQIVFSQRNQRHFLQIMPFQDGYGLNWLIGVMVPESDFMEQIYIDTQITLLFCAGVLTASVLLGLGAARCMTRSIEQLSGVSQALAQGNWDISFPEDSPIGELQVLAQSLNQMAVQLQQSFDRVNIALQESQEKFTQVFRTCPDAIGIVTLDGRYVEVNDAFVTLFGYTQAEVIGRTAAEIGHWVDLKQRQRYVQLVQTGEPARNLEFTFRSKAGELLTVLFSADSIELQGQPYIVGIAKDITDRKQTEAALRQSEERNQAILSAIPDLMTLVSAEGVYLGSIRSNALIDLVSEDIDPVGRCLTELLPPEVANMQIQLGQQALATGEVQIFEQQLWFDGRWQYEELRVAPCGTDAVLIMIRNITDRKQAEVALRHSEAALRRAQQVAHVGSWEIDVLTQQVTWSEESFHIFDWDVTQPEPNLSQFYELVHPDDRAALQRAINHTISTGDSYKTEFRIIHPDGSLRYVEARGEATRNEQGQVVQLLGTNLDITDRQQTELALRQSEAVKNQILKAIPDLIVWMNADGTYIDLIDGGSATNLYIKSEAIGKNLYDVMPPELAQARINAIQQALQTGEVQIYEQQFSLGDAIHHEEVRVVAVGSDGILVIVRDITDRKRAEAALLDSETRFRSAFWDAPIGMALIGLDDRWIKVNPILCEMLDCTETELLAIPASNLVYPEDRNKLQQCIQQVFTENRNAQVELRYLCQQGLVVWGALSLSLVRDAQAQPLYYVAQIQDITERQAIDRIKNEFISIVSHELRTPLTAIRGFLGLLDTGIYDNKPDKAKRMINQALSNSDRLVRLVNDILDLERLSSGRIQWVMKVCDATTLMRQAVAGIQSIADQATVRVAIEETLAQVWADPDPIIQTLTNLLSNAIKFSPPHSVVTLAARTQTDSVLFSVTDQGRGIPADKLEIIFGRFQQVDVSDSRQKGGTGLGLAICQSIVQQHEGNIWAESTLGEGSTFYFTLPLPKGEMHD